jgi:hypothetical protein
MKSVLEIHAIEALERWHAQISDLIDSGVFGEHNPSDCLFCRAQRIVESIQDLRDKMYPPNSLSTGSGDIASQGAATHIAQPSPGNAVESGAQMAV